MDRFQVSASSSVAGRSLADGPGGAKKSVQAHLNNTEQGRPNLCGQCAEDSTSAIGFRERLRFVVSWLDTSSLLVSKLVVRGSPYPHKKASDPIPRRVDYRTAASTGLPANELGHVGSLWQDRMIDALVMRMPNQSRALGSCFCIFPLGERLADGHVSQICSRDSVSTLEKYQGSRIEELPYWGQVFLGRSFRIP